MGLFDFVKEIGRKLFNRDEEAAEKIKKHIEEQNPGGAAGRIQPRRGFDRRAGGKRRGDGEGGAHGRQRVGRFGG